MVTRPGVCRSAAAASLAPAMAAGAVPLIPAPLTGTPFLKASHVPLGAERGAPGGAWQPFSHTQFPPFWGVHRAAPAPPPRSGQVLNPVRGVGGATCSETRLAFPERPLQPLAAVVRPGSHVRMHTDPRIRALAAQTRESFPWPRSPPRRPPQPAAKRWEDSIPRGDREKIRLPPSLYSSSFPAPEPGPAARPWRSLRGRVPAVLPGDGQARYHTSYQEQFQGEWSPAAEPSEKHVSRIKLGDPRSSGSVSEQKHAYSAPAQRTHRAYDKERAASQTHHTNLRLGDGCARFCPSTSELFPAHSPEPVTIVRPNKYASSIPRGDEDPERNQALARTTTQLSYPEPHGWNLTPKPDLLLRKHQSSVCLGAKSSGSHFFSTAQQADYGPPRQSPRVKADSKSHHESHIPFSYQKDECFVTTMQAMLVPHRQQKQRLSEDVLQQIKGSHLGLPWRVQNQFRTEQKDEFTPKSRGPAEIQKANSQVSCVPLGTLKSYCPQRTVLSAP